MGIKIPIPIAPLLCCLWSDTPHSPQLQEHVSEQWYNHCRSTVHSMICKGIRSVLMERDNSRSRIHLLVVVAVAVVQLPQRRVRLRVSQIQHWMKHVVSFELPVMMMVLVWVMPSSSWYVVAGTVVGAAVVEIVVAVCLFVVSFLFRSCCVVLCCVASRDTVTQIVICLRTITQTSLEGLEVETREICNFKRKKKCGWEVVVTKERAPANLTSKEACQKNP